METDEDLKLASKNWNRLVETATKIGYREGVEDGSQSVYQEGFDQGYAEGINISFILGQYKGLMSNLPELEYPDEIKTTLSATRHGSCYICKNNSSNDLSDKPIAEIVNCQRSHSRKIIQTLYHFFSPLMKTRGISIDHLQLPQQ